MSTPESTIHTALVLQLVQHHCHPEAKELTDEQAVIIVRNASSLVRAMMALGMRISEEAVLPQ